MSKSKIAIVVAPSVFTWENTTAIVELIVKVKESNGIAMLIPSENDEESIQQILQIADGVILVAPQTFAEGGQIEAEDAFLRAIGRQAILDGNNAVHLIGDKAFFAGEQEWKDWATFHRIGIRAEQLYGDDQALATLAEFARTAGHRAAFMRLANGHNNRRRSLEVNSPVTHN